MGGAAGAASLGQAVGQFVGCALGMGTVVLAVMVGAADFFKEKAAAACRANGCDEKFAFS